MMPSLPTELLSSTRGLKATSESKGSAISANESSKKTLALFIGVMIRRMNPNAGKTNHVIIGMESGETMATFCG